MGNMCTDAGMKESNNFCGAIELPLSPGITSAQQLTERNNLTNHFCFNGIVFRAGIAKTNQQISSLVNSTNDRELANC